MKTALWILWPSFLIACVAEVLFFSVFDPVDFQLFGPIGLSRRAGYSIGFFLFWAIGAGSSALTFLLIGVKTEERQAPSVGDGKERT